VKGSDNKEARADRKESDETSGMKTVQAGDRLTNIERLEKGSTLGKISANLPSSKIR